MTQINRTNRSSRNRKFFEERRSNRAVNVSGMELALVVIVVVAFSCEKKRLATAPQVAAAGKLAAPAEPTKTKPAAAVPVAAAKTKPDEAASRQAFKLAYTVLMHPRCMNCHPNGDIPLQGDDSQLHVQNVKRGSDGKEKFALKCANCHQLVNLPRPNMPPGNPNWHLTPPDMPMVFQGKSPAELTVQLKDPTKNGKKTLDQIFHHVSEDKLVLRGRNPGDGRTKPPLTHDEFVAAMRTWIDGGAAIPE